MVSRKVGWLGMRRRLGRRDRYYEQYRSAKAEIPLVGQITEVNPELIRGYIVVAVLIDDTQVIAHNACCMPHIISSVTRNMIQRPELMQPHHDAATGHKS